MAHVIDYDYFVKWRKASGDGQLASHLNFRTNNMHLLPITVITYTVEQRQNVDQFVHDYQLYNDLQVEKV